MIRQATLADTDRLLEMGKRFVSESGYRERVSANPEKVAETVAGLLEHPDGVVFVSGSDATLTGMIAMVAYAHPFSGEKVAFEMVWWVEPEARGDGLRLLRAAEAWAKEHECRRVQMISPSERVSTLYAKLGYSVLETAFQKEL